MANFRNWCLTELLCNGPQPLKIYFHLPIAKRMQRLSSKHSSFIIVLPPTPKLYSLSGQKRVKELIACLGTWKGESAVYKCVRARRIANRRRRGWRERYVLPEQDLCHIRVDGISGPDLGGADTDNVHQVREYYTLPHSSNSTVC